VLDRQPLCGAVSLDQFTRELESEKRLALPGKAVWMTMQTQIPAEVANQAQWLAGHAPQAQGSRIAADQISRLTWIALSHGMLGLIYEAPGIQTLEAPQDPTSAELLLLARQLDLIEPLLVATGTARRVVELGSGIQGGVLSSGRTHVVLPWRHDHFDQVLPPADAPGGNRTPSTLTLVVPGVGEPSEAHLITTADTQRLTVAREAGGVRVAADSLLPRDIVVLTQDAAFAQRIKSLVSADAARMSDLERTLLASEATRFGTGGAMPAADERGLRESRAALAAARRQRLASLLLHPVLRSSPLARIVELHEADLQLATLDRRPLQAPNLLPGGDFESVDIARQAGWQHVQLAGRESAHDIELVTGNVRSGSYCVRIRRREDGLTDAVDAVEPSVWLASPRVPLVAGDAIRVSGWVRGGSHPGANNLVVIEDSLGGRPLSLRAEVSDQWQPFVMYRAAGGAHEWSCRLANGGAGEVHVDGLTVQRVPRELIGQLTGANMVRDSRRLLFDAPRSWR
jgi:hypothetical protein